VLTSGSQLRSQVAAEAVANHVHRLADDLPDEVFQEICPCINRKPQLLLCTIAKAAHAGDTESTKDKQRATSAKA